MNHNEAASALLSDTLGHAGYEVLTADGEEGLSAGQHQDVHLIVTELVLPESEALEHVRALRERFPHAGILAISAALDADFLKTAVALGAQAIIPKPMEPDRLLPAVRGLIG